MATYLNQHLLTKIASESDYKQQYNNQSLSGLFPTAEVELLNGENSIVFFFKSVSALTDINFAGSFDRTNWFFLEADNVSSSSTPPYSRPQEIDTSVLNIDNSGNTFFCMTWIFKNCFKLV